LGSVCNLGCTGGFPLAGGNSIMCELNANKQPEWTWEGLKPFCQGKNNVSL